MYWSMVSIMVFLFSNQVLESKQADVTTAIRFKETSDAKLVKKVGESVTLMCDVTERGESVNHQFHTMFFSLRVVDYRLVFLNCSRPLYPTWTQPGQIYQKCDPNPRNDSSEITYTIELVIGNLKVEHTGSYRCSLASTYSEIRLDVIDPNLDGKLSVVGKAPDTDFTKDSNRIEWIDIVSDGWITRIDVAYFSTACGYCKVTSELPYKSDKVASGRYDADPLWDLVKYNMYCPLCKDAATGKLTVQFFKWSNVKWTGTIDGLPTPTFPVNVLTCVSSGAGTTGPTCSGQACLKMWGGKAWIKDCASTTCAAHFASLPSACRAKPHCCEDKDRCNSGEIIKSMTAFPLLLCWLITRFLY